VILLPIGRSGSPWGDDEMLRTALELIVERLAPRRAHFATVGELAAGSDPGAVRVIELDRTSDPGRLARYYQAADLYLHCARADTFPNVVLEALACGTPVVASAIGGIPEQIKSADLRAIHAIDTSGLAEATGLLVPRGDASAMADAVVALVTFPAARLRLGENAAADVQARFDLETEADRYLAWYRTIIERRSRYADPTHRRTATVPAGQSPMAMD
jgi:glycosyltransferase involved in cell wall biosynthesis